jgi:hypothetical protein
MAKIAGWRNKWAKPVSINESNNGNVSNGVNGSNNQYQ